MNQLRTVTPAAAPGSIAVRAARVVTLALVVLALWARPARADDVLPGIDMFVTAQCGAPGGGTFVDFSSFPGPLPAGFFDPGSDPFGGTISFTGQPLVTAPAGVVSPVDTIVERQAPATLPTCPSSDTVPIEILALNLMSCSPIVVTYFGGMNPELWTVDTWLMSCRVLKRRVEEVVLESLVQSALLQGVVKIRGCYIPTPRNSLVADHYERLGFCRIDAAENGGQQWELGVATHNRRLLPMRTEDDSQHLRTSGQ